MKATELKSLKRKDPRPNVWDDKYVSKNIWCEYTHDALGTANPNPEAYEEYCVGPKDKNGDKMLHSDKIKEELAMLPEMEDGEFEKGVTVFRRDKDGKPILLDHQFKGFIKEALGVIASINKLEVPCTKGKILISPYTFKKVIDRYVFVYPKEIALNLPEDVEVTMFTRPLRGDTMKGERISLATSELVPSGTEFRCEVRCLIPALMPIIEECLDYGIYKGVSQWRNSGRGSFMWGELEE